MFDWEALAQNGVGVWPQKVPDFGTDRTVRDAAGLREVRAAFRSIGFGGASEGPFDDALATLLRAVQRHWQPEAVRCEADAGTLARLFALACLVGDPAAA